MHSKIMILLLFSALGLIDGALFALLFRRSAARTWRFNNVDF